MKNRVSICFYVYVNVREECSTLEVTSRETVAMPLFNTEVYSVPQEISVKLGSREN